MEAIFLVCGAGGPQLKRNPLGCSHHGRIYMADLLIACELTSPDLQARKAGLLPGLVRKATERCAATNGYRWTFSPTEGLLGEIGQVIAAERQCCRFLRFIVAAEPDGGPISLEVTGPPGTVEFLDQLVAKAAA